MCSGLGVSERARFILRGGRDNSKFGKVWGGGHCHTWLLRV